MLAHPRQEPGQQQFRGRGEHREVDGPGGTGEVFGPGGLDGGEGGGDAGGHPGQDTTVLGEPHPTPDALHERHPGLALQRPELL